MRKSKYTKELLTPIVTESTSIAGVIKKLGLKKGGGSHTFVRFKIVELGIDTTHFTGQGWSKGQTAETNQSLATITNKLSFTDNEVFVENSPISNGTRLTKRLLRLGWEYKCFECKLVDWNNKPIALDLDHINGKRNDNRFCNLRFLCPNCHRQTANWGSRNTVYKNAGVA